MLRTLCQATLISKDNSSSQATILGRRGRFDVMNAAFVNGVSSHIFDFDDTHLKTTIHPAEPVVSAILALTEYHPVSDDGR
jgi:2-methylcitrate dehydratase PrpD